MLDTSASDKFFLSISLLAFRPVHAQPEILACIYVLSTWTMEIVPG